MVLPEIEEEMEDEEEGQKLSLTSLLLGIECNNDIQFSKRFSNRLPFQNPPTLWLTLVWVTSP